MKPAANHNAWAIGTQRKRGGFHVRRIVWGLLMATAERRDGEQIRAAVLLVERHYKRRTLPKDLDSLLDAKERSEANAPREP